MTINELIIQLQELKERGFGETKLMKHVPILYTDKDDTIYENMYSPGEPLEFGRSLPLHLGVGTLVRRCLVGFLYRPLGTS